MYNSCSLFKSSRCTCYYGKKKPVAMGGREVTHISDRAQIDLIFVMMIDEINLGSARIGNSFTRKQDFVFLL